MDMQILTAFTRNDWRSVRRDSLLLYVIFVPWMMVLLVRLLLPSMARWLSQSYGIDLALYYPLLLSLFFVFQAPALFGMVIGFLVLDERDDKTLLALQVTPLPITTYAAYRLGIALVLSVVYLFLLLPLSGLMPLRLLPGLIPVAFCAALFAPLVALFLASFAGNKVEGLALLKGMGFLALIPLAAYFIPSGWQLLAGLIPTYWPVKAYWLLHEGGSYWPYVLAGAAYQLTLIALLLRRFRARLRQ